MRKRCRKVFFYINSQFSVILTYLLCSVVTKDDLQHENIKILEEVDRAIKYVLRMMYYPVSDTCILGTT